MTRGGRKGQGDFGFTPASETPGLDDRQRWHWLRLWRSDGIGPRTFVGLVNKFGGAEAALNALPDLARERARPIRIAEPRAIDAEMALASKLGASFVALGEGDYPVPLRAIADPPPLLAVLGEKAVFKRPAVAFVGARNASVLGLSMAERLAQGVSVAGFATVSGLARGIDTRVHAASVSEGTIGVLASGLVKPYPPENARLMAAMAEKGAVVTEMPLAHEPRGKDFPRRNRIISGLALGTVVVEATRQSGSLITARFALEQGRQVFAVPGSPLDPRAEGPNDLIHQGAALVRDARDILDGLASMVEDAPDRLGATEAADFSPHVLPHARDPIFLDDAEAPGALGGWLDDEDVIEGAGGVSAVSPRARVLALLSPVPAEIDQIARDGGVSAREAATILFDLEQEGRLIRHPGNKVALRP